MKRFGSILLSVAVVAAGACGSGTRSEVLTNSGGILDCPSETVEYHVFDYGPDAAGSPTPGGALETLTPDLGLPPGTPAVESDSGDEVVFIYADTEGNGLGRAMVVRLKAVWVVQSTEHCD